MVHYNHSNQVVSEDKLSQMVSRADKDATGCISEDDFLEAFDWLMSQGQDERDYMAIFNMLVGWVTDWLALFCLWVAVSRIVCGFVGGC